MHGSKAAYSANNSFKPSPLRGLGRAESHRAGRLNSGVRAHMEKSLVEILVQQRQRLLQSYVIHVLWFTAMIFTAVFHASRITIAASILLALITVPPVIYYASAVHKTCRTMDPRARTIGLVPMIIMTVFLTPFESGLIVPAKNLWVSGKLLKEHQDDSLGP